jgi:hypothetical protein
MDRYVTEYGQLYQGLSRDRYIRWNGAGTYAAQFTAAPLNADWYTPGRNSIYADLVSPARNGFYHVGSSRVTQAYRDLLETFDPVRGEFLSPEVGFALRRMESPYLTIEGNLTDDLANWERADHPAFKVEIDTSVSCVNEWTRFHMGSGEASHDIGISALFGGSPCQYTFTARGLKAYQIIRGDWYNDKLAQPNLPLTQGATLTPKDFFGYGGALQHIPEYLVVVWKPEIELNMRTGTSGSHRAARTSLSKAKGLLGLDLEFDPGRVLLTANSYDSSQTVRIQSANPNPQLWLIASMIKYL